MLRAAKPGGIVDETPYIDDFGLFSKNNEGISALLELTETLEDGSVVPLDLTGRLFKAQARKQKSKTSELICDIEISIEGDPTLGHVRLKVDDGIVSGLAPGKGHYDVLTRAGANGQIDNLYMAPFVIEGGVTEWN